MAETEAPWERWQYRREGQSEWNSMSDVPSWGLDYEYRRKPRVILINGIEVPEPLREKPEVGAKYWIPDIWDTEGDPTSAAIHWKNDGSDNGWFSIGICHLTKEAAELHAKALLSFTRQ